MFKATPRRWFGSGRSEQLDARAAGAEAASAAVEGRRAKLVVVFCEASMDFEALLAGVRAEVGDVPLIGCSGGAFDGGGQEGCTVVVSALGGEGFEVRTTIATNVSAGQRAAGEKVAETSQQLTLEHQIMLLLCDGLTGEQHEVTRGAYGVLGASVPLAGGCAADQLKYEQTFQFYSDEDGVHVYSDALVAAAVGSEAPIGIGVAHGWHKVGEPMLVTSSHGGRVRTLDGEPALDVFLKRVGAPRSITDDPLEFRLFALRHPLGMSRRSGEDLKVIHGGHVEDGSIDCLADVAQGSLLWTMESDHEGLISGVDDAFDEAFSQLDGAAPVGLLVFDCGVRQLFLGPEGVREEIASMAKRADGVPFGGFYTYGEFARTRGARGMHHLTLVLVAFG